jgi:hypothetical protein
MLRGDSMTVAGFYTCYLTGSDGAGFAMLILQRGKIIGADPLGTRFDGKYKLATDTGRISINVSVQYPPNMRTIQGVDVGPHGLKYEINSELPELFNELPYVTVETPQGEVNVKFVKVRGLDD